MLQLDNKFNSHLPLLSRQAQRRLDQAWMSYTGLSQDILIEQAGMAVAEAACRYSEARHAEFHDCRVLILGGKGNNGADAWVSARHLVSFGFSVSCCDLDVAVANNSSLQLTALHNMGVSFITTKQLTELDTPDIVIDGILGTGFKLAKGISPLLTDIFKQVSLWRRLRSYVISIDIPSGIEADTGAMSAEHICADHTVTFVSPKTGIAAAPGCTCVGEISIVPLSMPPKWVEKILDDLILPRLIDISLVSSLRPLRPADGHKGTFGRALLVGGNEGMAGAIALAGQAAARAGAGLITLAVGKSAFLPVLSAFPEGLTHDISEADDPLHSLIDYTKNKQAVAAGPGLGRPEWLPYFLKYLLKTVNNLVLDADALNQLSASIDEYENLFKNRSELGLQPVILTPHPGEFKRLAPDLIDLLASDRQSAASALASRLDAIVVLKGAATVVALPDGKIYINSSGNDGMAKGGSGDCLTGIITGLLAQGIVPEHAAICAVYLHGLAGDLAAESIGRTAFLPQDLLLNMGKAWLKSGWIGDRRSDIY